MLLILSGPSCVGKGPLLAALRRCRPDLAWSQPVVVTSRGRRPGETDGVDCHFRSSAAIEALDPARYYVYPMRGQLRAIDLDEVESLLSAGPPVVLELNPRQVEPFRAHPRVAPAAGRVHALLLQPVSVEEAADLARAGGVGEREAVAEVMRVKQIERARGMGMLLTGRVLADIEVRAAHAWEELTLTAPFDEVIVNHDAEGSDHWRFDPPLGDAGRVYRRVVELLAAAGRG